MKVKKEKMQIMELNEMASSWQQQQPQQQQAVAMQRDADATGNVVDR